MLLPSPHPRLPAGRVCSATERAVVAARVTPSYSASASEHLGHPARNATAWCKGWKARRYALHVPENLPLDAAAPLMCAGITVWSPMQYYGLNKPGMKLGVVGLGGLGHMAVRFGKVRSIPYLGKGPRVNKPKEYAGHGPGGLGHMVLQDSPG